MRHKIKKYLFRFRDFMRKQYHALKALRLKNKTPTILTNNCVGGVIYHDLGLKFYSPTINLWMRTDDYLCFLENLEAFISVDVKEVFEDSITYPIGCLSLPDGQTVRLYFMHYASFEEAHQKWNDRKKRINYDNLFAIMEFPGKNTTEERYASVIERFDHTPIPYKALLTANQTANSPNAVVMDFYQKESYLPGRILKYKSRFSIKRYLDEFDYISFLNSHSS